MHHNTLNQYIKNGHKENNYQCLNIGSFHKIGYYNYPNCIYVYMYGGTSKISAEKGVYFIINKDLTSVEIAFYDKNYQWLIYYQK